MVRLAALWRLVWNGEKLLLNLLRSMPGLVKLGNELNVPVIDVGPIVAIRDIPGEFKLLLPELK